jgi:hypothetical protein
MVIDELQEQIVPAHMECKTCTLISFAGSRIYVSQKQLN